MAGDGWAPIEPTTHGSGEPARPGPSDGRAGAQGGAHAATGRVRTGPGRRGGVLVAVLVVAAVVAVVAGVVVGGLGDDLAGDDGADDPAAADGAGAGADGSLTTEVADAQTTLVISTDMPLADLVALGAAIEPFDPATPPRLAGAPG